VKVTTHFHVTEVQDVYDFTLTLPVHPNYMVLMHKDNFSFYYNQYVHILGKDYEFCARFEVIVVVNVQVGFWVVTPCSVVVGYQHFRGPCCLN
jgi:hypothetical protein